ncbi:head-tail connector protein [Rhizobium phaseoli]|uniref:head-tail connector protein n=1 Tax=Rhizobium phaseoli TaxID=396 RepID=UPI00161E202C|nr:head-tail connector protein [Rhizobium phaseoli]MDK4727465.1 head-tail connector protein [Rhizobium phaseoli]
MNEWTRLVRTVAPASPVVSLEEAKRHLRVLHDDDNADIEAFIAAAIAAIEGPNGIGIALSPQTWRMSLDHFPCEIVIPLGPVTAVTSVAYTDAAGSPATVSGLRYDLDSSPLRIWPARDTTWPTIYCEPGAVKVTFVCGYATLPPDLRAAILLLVGHFYERREAVTTDLKAVDLPMGVSSILERYRVGRFA